MMKLRLLYLITLLATPIHLLHAGKVEMACGETSGKKVTPEALLMAIYINHQLTSLADQVINPDALLITPETILKNTESTQEGTKKIGGKIPIEIDFSTWPVLDDTEFNKRHSEFTLQNKRGVNAIRVHRPERTLKSILENYCSGKIDINNPPGTQEVGKHVWATYLFFQGLNPPAEGMGNPEATLVKALESLASMQKELDEGLSGFNAIDLGCGIGRDTVSMLKAGWKVCASDLEQSALDQLKKNAEIANLPVENLHRLCQSFEDLELEKVSEGNKIFLINASYSLPYAGSHSDRIIDGVKKTLQRGGYFSGHFFLNEDPLSGAIGVKTYGVEELDPLFPTDQFERVLWERHRYSTPRVDGTEKEWHEFHVVVRKR